MSESFVSDLEPGDAARHHRRMTQLEAELEATRRDLGQFAYLASHDLQEPLRMVSSYLGLLERRMRDRLDPKEQQYLHRAVDGARRMQEMLAGLLTYSRLTTDPLDLEDVDLALVFRGARGKLAAVIERRGAQITMSDFPVARVDATKLQAAMVHLLDNALKFSPSEPRIHVHCACEGGALRLSVRDEGVGIGPADSAKIGSPFQRLHSRDEYPGVGLGLAMVRKIVERHGGAIAVEGTLGQGFQVLITIPQGPMEA